MWDTPNKIKAIENFKNQYNIDLNQSYAYGDTNGDWGMLQLVGLPTAFNPSKELLLKIKADPNMSQKCKVVVERKDLIFHLNSDVLIED